MKSLIEAIFTAVRPAAQPAVNDSATNEVVAETIEKNAVRAERSIPTTRKAGQPRILLIDTDTAVATTLRTAGYNITTASFGPIAKVEQGPGLVPVSAQSTIDEHEEQDIIVVDLLSAVVEELQDEVAVDHMQHLWASLEHGFIDLRPLAMARLRADFDRIVSSGGAAIVFAQPRITTVYHKGYREFGKLVPDGNPMQIDNWGFLSALYPHYALLVNSDKGKMCTVSPEVAKHFPELNNLLKKYIDNMSFLCTLSFYVSSQWFPLCENKYGDTVAGLILPEARTQMTPKRDGFIFLFPDVSDRAGFLKDFLDSALPQMCPRLFPGSEKGKWVHRSEYEAPKIAAIEERIEAIQEEAASKIAQCKLEIEAIRSDYRPVYDLLRTQGEPLVAAVKFCLRELGFTRVIDADQELLAGGKKNATRNEDLRIEDPGPLLLIEIKGIRGRVPDAEALQVWKYIAPRMKLLGRTDIRGLSIVNHECGTPPLEREPNPFRQDILDTAEAHDIGLMTTWDLFRLLRGMRRNGWKQENLKPIFYHTGHISILPANYRYIGTVERYFQRPNAFTVRIADGMSIEKGARIAYEGRVEFYEQHVDSLQVNSKDVNLVPSGELAGFKLHSKNEVPKPNMRVYRVE